MEAMGKKLISVIMPVYNRERTLRRAAEAVLSQSYEPLELILVDDGSTDGSRDICRKLSEIHDNVISIRQENRGPAAARNRGLAMAAGEYIAFADSDDSMDISMYERLTEGLSGTGADIALCGFSPLRTAVLEDIKALDGTCGSESLGSQERDKTISKAAPITTPITVSATNNTSIGSKDTLRNDRKKATNRLNKVLVLSEKPEILALITDNKRPFGWGIWNKLYKRELIGDLRFNENLHINEDLDFNLRVFSKAKSICYTEDKLYYYDDSSSGLSKQISSEPYLAAMKVIEGILEGRYGAGGNKSAKSPNIESTINGGTDIGENASARKSMGLKAPADLAAELYGKKACDNLRAELLNQGLMALEVMLLSGNSLSEESALYIRHIFRKYEKGEAFKCLRKDQKLLLRAFCCSKALFKIIYYIELPIKLMLGGGVIYRRIKLHGRNQ